MSEKPLPIPEGMTQEQIEAMTINDGKWRWSYDFVCRTCGGSAYLHPYTNSIWGCKKCGTTTYSVSVFFRPVDGHSKPHFRNAPLPDDDW